MKASYPIKPFVKEGLTHNQIILSIDYCKKRGGALLTLQTAGRTEDGFVKFSIFGSPRATFLVEGGWKTNSKKKLSIAWTTVCRDLETKTGPCFTAVETLLQSCGSGLVELVEAPAGT